MVLLELKQVNSGGDTCVLGEVTPETFVIQAALSDTIKGVKFCLRLPFPRLQ